jgi:hypothetical protein
MITILLKTGRFDNSVIQSYQDFLTKKMNYIECCIIQCNINIYNNIVYIYGIYRVNIGRLQGVEYSDFLLLVYIDIG